MPYYSITSLPKSSPHNTTKDKLKHKVKVYTANIKAIELSGQLRSLFDDNKETFVNGKTLIDGLNNENEHRTLKHLYNYCKEKGDYSEFYGQAKNQILLGLLNSMDF